jgi:hypothetical protein
MLQDFKHNMNCFYSLCLIKNITPTTLHYFQRHTTKLKMERFSNLKQQNDKLLNLTQDQTMPFNPNALKINPIFT